MARVRDFGWLCESCQRWYAHAISVCPNCKIPKVAGSGLKNVLTADPLSDVAEGVKARKTRERGTKNGMSEAERKFDEWMFAGLGLFEPITLRLRNGHRYTPDFISYEERGVMPIICYEVKGGYQLPSHQRARLAFDQAAIEFPWLRFEWWTLKNGEWQRG